MKEHHKDVDFLYPNMRMFDEIPKRGLPTRRVRWCCEVFKESHTPKGATLLMGIRAEESPRRAAMWSEVEYHRRSKCNCVLPVFKWTIDHVWEFIRVQKLAYCSLYDEGFNRLGCIGCSMAGVAGRLKEFARWPRIEQQYKDATRKLFDTNKNAYVQRFPMWESLWDWWLSDDPAPAAPCGELKLFEPEAEP